MTLALIAGPANAGKVELLLDRYLEALDREPVLIVPTGSDVERVERQLLERCRCLMSGTIGTFDDVFARIAGHERPLIGDAQRALLVRRVVAGAQLTALATSARFGGFADALSQALAEVESGLLEPVHLEGELALLYAAYRDALEGLGLWDKPGMRRHAVERLRNELDAWHGEPVFAYGFEDLTGAEWALLEGLAGRTEVSVSLPYEPGRPAFASLARTAEDLQRLAGANVVELPARYGEVAQPALAHLERTLFADERRAPVPTEGAIRFFEGAGTRGALELVGEELLALLRAGTPAERIGIVCPSTERLRAPLETALGTLGVPYSLDGELRVAQTPFGQALTALVRFAWLGGTRRELFTFLRSPFSGLERRSVDFVEGRLRGRAVQLHDRVLEETEKLRGAPLPILDELRDASEPIDAIRTLATRMLRNAYDPERPPVGETSRLDLRAYEAVDRLLRELARWGPRLPQAADSFGRASAALPPTHAAAVTREEAASSLERHTMRMLRGDEPGRVAVVDLLRARTRRFDVVFVLGLEEGSLPRRGGGSPFLDDEARRALDGGGARLQKPDPVSRDRYLFYTACTRPLERLYLVRESATDDGSPREPSPFWDEVQSLFDPDEVRRWTRRRRLSDLTWPLDGAPSERERLRALAELGADDAAAADALARANGWERRLERAFDAFKRPTRITHPLVREQLESRATFNVTELERFADCSSAWFVERFLDPKSIDKEVDALTRGSVAHTALYRFFTRVPKELGVEKLDERVADDAVRLMRTCLDEALQGVRMDMTEMQQRELDQTLWRDLEAVVRAECESELSLVPRYFEHRFGTDVHPGLDLGGGLTLTGKIDRIDVDPFGARGIVQDYKSGKHAHSAAKIDSELRLQIPLYMLVLRDLVGLEPLGGLYRPLAGERKARGLLRRSESETLHGFSRNDYLDEDAFWASVEKARAKAQELAQRIREGDVRHDPKGNDCPAWCDLWSMCRVERA